MDITHEAVVNLAKKYMAINTQQRLQMFQDSPQVIQADFNLSASACEALTFDELVTFEDDGQEKLFEQALSYPDRHGSLALRRAIAAKYHGVSAENVLVGNGLDDGLTMVFDSLIKPGDRVVVLSPAYPPLLLLPRRQGAEVVRWLTRPENDWVPDLDELKQLIDSKTTMVVTSFPQNPVGFMPDIDFIRKLIEIVSEKDIILVSDEVYSGLPHDRATGVSQLVEHYEKAISMHGLSKTFGLPGLRVGWLAMRHTPTLDKIRNHYKLNNCYVSSPVDYLSQLALRHEKKILSRNGKIVQENLDTAKDFFSRNEDLFRWKPPMAGVLSFPKWLGAGGTQALSQQLLEQASIAVVPSYCFEAGDNHVRISVSKRSFRSGLDSLENYLHEST